MSESTFDLDAYFDRIGYEGPREATAPVLAAIAQHHALAIPFENLDVLLDRPIPLDAASLQPREIFGESFPCPVIHTSECVSGCMIRSVISWPNKFITSSSGKYESYDLANDPDETRNLFGSRNPAAQQLGAKMASWIKSMPRQSKQRLKLDPEVVRRLKSLGYIQ